MPTNAVFANKGTTFFTQKQKIANSAELYRKISTSSPIKTRSASFATLSFAYEPPFAYKCCLFGRKKPSKLSHKSRDLQTVCVFAKNVKSLWICKSFIRAKRSATVSTPLFVRVPFLLKKTCAPDWSTTKSQTMHIFTEIVHIKDFSYPGGRAGNAYSFMASSGRTSHNICRWSTHSFHVTEWQTYPAAK